MQMRQQCGERLQGDGDEKWEAKDQIGRYRICFEVSYNGVYVKAHYDSAIGRVGVKPRKWWMGAPKR